MHPRVAVSALCFPTLSATGSRDAYLATLERLRPLVAEAEWVVPGHGAPIDGIRALAILGEDVRYLTDWELPLTRRTAAQRASRNAMADPRTTVTARPHMAAGLAPDSARCSARRVPVAARRLGSPFSPAVTNRSTARTASSSAAATAVAGTATARAVGAGTECHAGSSADRNGRSTSHRARRCRCEWTRLHAAVVVNSRICRPRCARVARCSVSDS